MLQVTNTQWQMLFAKRSAFGKLCLHLAHWCREWICLTFISLKFTVGQSVELTAWELSLGVQIFMYLLWKFCRWASRIANIVSLFRPLPIQLSVTVTPRLPPLLTNESYQCQLADGERLRAITVDAEEVIPNTVYQCNITGRRIPTFTGVQLGKMN